MQTFIFLTKNDQLSEDGAKVNGNLKPEVPYKNMESKCSSSINLPHELRAGLLVCHTILLYGKKCVASKMDCAQLEWRVIARATFIPHTFVWDFWF